MQPPPPLLLLLFALASCSSPGDRLAVSRGKGIGVTEEHFDPHRVQRYIGTRSYRSVDEGSPNFVNATAETTDLETTTGTTTMTERSTALSSSTAASNRVPSQLDLTSFHEGFGTASEVPNVTYTSLLSTLPSDIVNITRRYRREGVDPCSKFIDGDPVKQEFYSPNYPNPYPKNTSCFKVLEADPGMVLRVEFRDSFELEDQPKCDYDYLEVRDGKYGFSRLIGRFCRAFPFPEITSSSKYLWLHFHSDSSIQGSGFRAVYTMMPRPTVRIPESEECILNVTNIVEYEIKTSEIEEQKKTAVEHGTDLDCIWNITVKEGYKIQMAFPQFHLDKPNECDINFVQVYNQEPSLLNHPSLISNFCGSIADLVTSKGNEVWLRFFVTKATINSNFEALITVIREKDGKDKGCEDDEFDCQDACIADELKCNGRANCRYRFDEDSDVCSTEQTGLNMHSEHVIIVLVVFTLLMSGLCFTCIYNCVKKLIRDHKIIKEHIRQSRERRLDELGRKSTSCSEIGGKDHHHHHHEHRDASESPGLEVLANPRELVRTSAGAGGREYGSTSRERSLRHQLSVDLGDIHHSNNVTNATQERLHQESSSEERETRDMACQTRESLFDSGIVLKPTGHPAFTTFGFPTPESTRRPSVPNYHPNHHYHHHPHPHYHPHEHPYHEHHHQHHHLHEHSAHELHRQTTDPGSQGSLSRGPSPAPSVSSTGGSLARRSCPRHSGSLVPAPPGWSLHESSPGDVVERSPGPSPHLTELPPLPYGATDEENDESKPLARFVRQRTVGSGENYGFIYGSEPTEPSLRPQGIGGTGAGGLAKPVKCPKVGLDPSFKTEAVIEVEQKRPFSIDSTKSAPDVIATH